MINLSETLSYLPSDKITELETITSRIIKSGKAEMVILFGSYARGDYKEQRGEKQGKKSDYDLLIATKDEDSKRTLQSELRGIFTDIERPVQIIIHKIDDVNKSIGKKQYFFSDIRREGKLLFDSRRFQLVDEGKLSPAERVEAAEEDFKEWYGTAVKIINLVRDDNRLGAFDLQQAVEMCYTTIEMVFTHYNPYEHNLENLRERVIEFDSRVKEALPYETEEQKKLFDDLNYAYIAGRYRSEKEFPITKDQLEYWSGEAKKLLELTELICKERIDCLREIEKSL
jgi:predicted nucleotidyltransferase